MATRSTKRRVRVPNQKARTAARAAARYDLDNLESHEVAALISQGIARLRHGHARFDLLWTVWTIPWDFIRGLAHAIGRRLAWIPPFQFAWRTRFVVGTIAVVLEA